MSATASAPADTGAPDAPAPAPTLDVDQGLVLTRQVFSGMENPSHTTDPDTPEHGELLSAVQAVLDAAEPAPDLDNTEFGPGHVCYIVEGRQGGQHCTLVLDPATNPPGVHLQETGKALRVPRGHFVAVVEQMNARIPSE